MSQVFITVSLALAVTLVSQSSASKAPNPTENQAAEPPSENGLPSHGDTVHFIVSAQEKTYQGKVESVSEDGKTINILHRDGTGTISRSWPCKVLIPKYLVGAIVNAKRKPKGTSFRGKIMGYQYDYDLKRWDNCIVDKEGDLYVIPDSDISNAITEVCESQAEKYVPLGKQKFLKGEVHFMYGSKCYRGTVKSFTEKDEHGGTYEIQGARDNVATVPSDDVIQMMKPDPNYPYRKFTDRLNYRVGDKVYHKNGGHPWTVKGFFRQDDRWLYRIECPGSFLLLHFLGKIPKWIDWFGFRENFGPAKRFLGVYGSPTREAAFEDLRLKEKARCGTPQAPLYTESRVKKIAKLAAIGLSIVGVIGWIFSKLSLMSMVDKKKHANLYEQRMQEIKVANASTPGLIKRLAVGGLLSGVVGYGVHHACSSPKREEATDTSTNRGIRSWFRSSSNQSFWDEYRFLIVTLGIIFLAGILWTIGYCSTKEPAQPMQDFGS